MGIDKRVRRDSTHVRREGAIDAEAIMKIMTDQTWARATSGIRVFIESTPHLPNVAMNEGWCLGCKQRGGECQCAELGTDPEWVEDKPDESESS